MRGKRRGYYWQEDIPEFEEVAGFGGARIMRDLRGKVHIQGGTDAERKQAHDWMLRFMRPVNQPRSQR